MGLNERRLVTEFQEKTYPALKSEIDAAAGFPVDVEVKWDTLMTEDAAPQASEWFPKIYFRPLIDALKGIASDDMGKKALKDGLKKIVIDGSHGTHCGAFTFDNGILSINHEPATNVDDVRERTDGIRKMVEEKL